MQRLVRWFALIASVAGAAFLLFLPLYSGMTESVSADGQVSRSAHSGTLVGVNGPQALIVLGIPMLAAVNAVLPWPASYRRPFDILGAVVATVFAFLGAFTVGLFFLPTAAALWVVALWPNNLHAAT